LASQVPGVAQCLLTLARVLDSVDDIAEVYDVRGQALGLRPVGWIPAFGGVPERLEGEVVAATAAMSH
jgi:hypothetical protein